MITDAEWGIDELHALRRLCTTGAARQWPRSYALSDEIAAGAEAVILHFAEQAGGYTSCLVACFSRNPAPLHRADEYLHPAAAFRRG